MTRQVINHDHENYQACQALMSSCQYVVDKAATSFLAVFSNVPHYHSGRALRAAQPQLCAVPPVAPVVAASGKFESHGCRPVPCGSSDYRQFPIPNNLVSDESSSNDIDATCEAPASVI